MYLILSLLTYNYLTFQAALKYSILYIKQKTLFHEKQATNLIFTLRIMIKEKGLIKKLTSYDYQLLTRNY